MAAQPKTTRSSKVKSDWEGLDETEIAARVQQDYEWAKSAVEPWHSEWAKLEDYYQGRQWKHRVVDPNRVQPVANKAFMIVESTIPILVANAPDPLVLPTHPAMEDAAANLTRIAKIQLSKLGFTQLLPVGERTRLKFGTSIWRVYWDPFKYNGLGDIGFEIVDPANFFVDPNCVDDVQTADYCMIAVKRSLSYLQARYPERAKEIQPDDKYMENVIYGNDEPIDPRGTQATLIEYWRKDPVLGLIRAVVVGNTVLRFDTDFYANGKYPFIVLRDYPLQRSFWGMGEITQILNLQDVLNTLFQVLLENVALANGQYVVDKNLIGTSDIQQIAAQLWKPGLMIPTDDVNAIRKLDGIAAPGWVTNLVQLIEQEIDDVSGFSPVLVGQLPFGIRSASGLLSLEEQAKSRINLKIQEQAKLIKQTVEFMIDYMAEFYTEDRYFRYEDSDNEPSWLVTNADMLTQEDDYGNIIFPTWDIDVQPGFDVAMSRSYLQQQAQQLYQMGILSATEVLKTMNFPGKDEIIARLTQQASLQGQAASLPAGMMAPSDQAQLAALQSLTAQGAGKTPMPTGQNANNTASPQDAMAQMQQSLAALQTPPQQAQQ